MTLEIIPDAGKSSVSEFEKLLMSRHTKTYEPDYAKEPITYEFTNDPALLHQYYRIREIMYRKMFNTQEFSGEEDAYDRISHILVARKGRLCIGGCRFTVREADEVFRLPMESSEVDLRNLFPDLRLDEYRHCEISRFALLEEYNDFDVFRTMSKMVFDSVQRMNIRWVFIKSAYPMARNWRKICNSLGVVRADICNDVKLPRMEIHPEIEWKLLLVEPPYHPEITKYLVETMAEKLKSEGVEA